jgi:hypothetical protein
MSDVLDSLVFAVRCFVAAVLVLSVTIWTLSLVVYLGTAVTGR